MRATGEGPTPLEKMARATAGGGGAWRELPQGGAASLQKKNCESYRRGGPPPWKKMARATAGGGGGALEKMARATAGRTRYLGKKHFESYRRGVPPVDENGESYRRGGPTPWKKMAGATAGGAHPLG